MFLFLYLSKANPYSTIFYTPFGGELGENILLAKNPIHYRAIVKK